MEMVRLYMPESGIRDALAGLSLKSMHCLQELQCTL